MPTQSGERMIAMAIAGAGGPEVLAVVERAIPVPGPGDVLIAVEAAALPEGLFTVWTNLFDTGRLRSDETLLVHGGASGMGTIAIQMARAFGARVFATAGTPEKCAACEALGAERAINYRTQDFVAELSRLTAGRGADVILDMVGGDYVMRNVRSLAPGGRIVNIAFPLGARVEVDFMALMRRGGSIAATMLRPRPTAEKGRIADRLLADVWPLLEAGHIRPVVAVVFPLAAAADAHRAFEAGRHIGKIVLDVRGAGATGSAIAPATIAAYRETDYWVGGDTPFTLRVGEFSPALAALHEARRVDSSAFITACNPFSRALDAAANAERQAALLHDLRQRRLGCVEGIGQHPSGDWPGEPSMLVLGIALDEARALGHAYEQNAIVWVGADATPRLMLLR